MEVKFAKDGVNYSDLLRFGHAISSMNSIRPSWTQRAAGTEVVLAFATARSRSGCEKKKKSR